MMDWRLLTPLTPAGIVSSPSTVPKPVQKMDGWMDGYLVLCSNASCTYSIKVDFKVDEFLVHIWRFWVVVTPNPPLMTISHLLQSHFFLAYQVTSLTPFAKDTNMVQP